MELVTKPWTNQMIVAGAGGLILLIVLIVIIVCAATPAGFTNQDRIVDCPAGKTINRPIKGYIQLTHLK